MGFLKCVNISLNINRFCKTNIPTMKYLSVAEKNDAAKHIAGFLSRGASRRREGLSPYNKIYEFDTQVNNQNVTMVMTSVSGHLLNYEFAANFRSWKSCNPVALFDAPIMKACKDGEKIKKTLEREIRSCSALIIWTDCDREGENIGFEIINVCTSIKPNLRVYRAKFSEITAASVFRALNNLGEPNKNVSNAVDVRQEMDLRTGAAFTRLQTLHLGKVFPQKLANKLISYGSCQFPTLGFVVERYKDIENFIPEPFWRIKMEHTKKELTVDFHWERDRLFVKQPCETLLEMCQENSTATVISVISKPKNKWRPVPLDTIEMEKTISRKLKINAKDTMKIAERLYTQGFISYPRTETNIFPKELNLRTLVEQQTPNNAWGEFANRILNDGGPNPRQGKKSDQAHPPIHPTKYAENLNGNEQRVYEYIVRHFLACVSKDAVGHETIVKVNIAEEIFTAKGLHILEKNYLDVYIYEKWNSKEIHCYTEGETFQPTVLQMDESQTTAPKFLTEADLISLMEKNGIGTDATHADHIDTIKSREYVGLHENMYFIPGTLGMGLVEGYDNIGLEVSLAKPILRSEFEKDLKLICDGQKDPQVVLQEQKTKYRAVFQNVINRIQELEEKLATRIEEQRVAVDNTQFTNAEQFQSIFKCPKCGNDMILKKRKNLNGFFVTCCGFPECKNAIWLPGGMEQVEVTENSCSICGVNTKKLKVKFKQGQNPFPGEPNTQEICIGGCDNNVLAALDISPLSVRRGSGDTTVNNSTRNQPPPPPPPGGGRIQANNTQTRTTMTQNNWSASNSTSSNDSAFPSINRNTSNNNWNAGNSNSSDSTFPRSNSTNSNRNSNSSTNDSGYNSWIRPNPGFSNNNKTTATQMNNNAWNNQPSGSNSWSNQSSTWNNQQGGSTNAPNRAPQNIADEDVVCNCGNAGLLLTVRKEGPNTGRKFYKCGNNACDFFLWAPSTDNPNQSFTNRPSSQSAPASSAAVKCECGLAAIQRMVQKEGPNKGKSFYTCPGAINARCNFFKWASDVEAGMGGSSDGGFPPGGGGGTWGNSWGNNSKKRKKAPAKKKPSGFVGNSTKGKRKCGICGEEGHTRTNCPNKS